MSQLVITAIGPASSVQDGGRFGAQRYGLVPSGAMDRLALAAANCLVGNERFAAAIEVGPLGAIFTAREGPVRVALVGAALDGGGLRSFGPPLRLHKQTALVIGHTFTRQNRQFFRRSPPAPMLLPSQCKARED